MPALLRLCWGAALVIFPASGLAEQPDWTGLRPGLAMEEVVRRLGEPLLRTRARGFDRLVYDGRGEVLFSGGPLTAWTAGTPSAESLARPAELDVLLRPVRAPAPAKPLYLPPPEYYREVSSTRFRYR
jgi:hypothetical protein